MTHEQRARAIRRRLAANKRRWGRRRLTKRDVQEFFPGSKFAYIPPPHREWMVSCGDAGATARHLRGVALELQRQFARTT